LVFRDKWAASGEELDFVPLHILLQVQSQLACTGAPYGYLLVCVGGNKLYLKKYERDEKIIPAIEVTVAKFWHDVLTGNEPPMVPQYDYSAVFELQKDGGGTELSLVGDKDADNIIFDYVEAKNNETKWKKRHQETRANLLDLVKSSEKATTDNYYVTAKCVERENGGKYRKINVKERKVR